VPTDENITAVTTDVAVLNPDSMRTGRANPFPFAPRVALSRPFVIAVDPDIAGSRGDADGSDAHRGRGPDSYNYFGRAGRPYDQGTC
jgi:hypothetical protein